MLKNIDKKVEKLLCDAERDCREIFEKLDDLSKNRTDDIMDAFAEFRVSESDFISSSGYGYGDVGRDKLDKIWARVFGTEAALVRPHIVNGTHALTIGLFALLRPNDVLLSVTGKPYDTLDCAIGITNKDGRGSLYDFGVKYREVSLLADTKIDFDGIEKNLTDDVKVVYLQRSRGYAQRRALTVSQIDEVYSFVKARSNAFVAVDNCYGEFTEKKEPNADLLIGSLIKNPGGGFAECGGYLAGDEKAVDLCAARLTSPGIGAECGASLSQNKNMYRGLFYAPHTVSQAQKTAILAAYILEKLGYDVSPKYNEYRSDIIEAVNFNSADKLCAFCRGIQSASPIDSFVVPEPWDMPGYADKVIMAAGAFVQGSSIELSCDGPLKPPYTAFFQGGLTYESGRIARAVAASKLISE